MNKATVTAFATLAALCASCAGNVPLSESARGYAPNNPDAPSTCTAIFPSYWQDPNGKFDDQWDQQPVTNQPPAGWKGPVFQLSDAFPAEPVDHKEDQPWREARFDAMFKSETSQADKTALAREYAWLVMAYLQDGNIDDDNSVEDDWDICRNTVRPWYHMPFQTYDGLSGRDFTHGLTREAPVTFNVPNAEHPGSGMNINSTMWAVGFYNATAAYTLGTVWRPDGTAAVPTQALSFDEGAVVGKLLFNTDAPDQLPILQNMPAWRANISDPSYCKCTPLPGEEICSMVDDAQQCGRSTSAYGPVRLLQFDIAIKDSRALQTSWVFGTFVADGQRKAGEPNPWNRISPLGLMWGNSTPPAGQLAYNYPSNPRENGFDDGVIFWGVVDMLNDSGGPFDPMKPGHLGCNSRLNGPADNASSSCMSCHGTASVPDRNIATPPIVTQFSPASHAVTHECVKPSDGDPSKGFDASFAAAEVVNDVSFADVDRLWFANTGAGKPFNTTVDTGGVKTNVLEGLPSYANGDTAWISTDYSLQMSGALVSWLQWQEHKGKDGKRSYTVKPQRRGQHR